MINSKTNRLSPEEIEKMIKDSEKFANEDKQVKIKDKYIKIKIRYTGKNLAVIAAIKTLYNISYA